MNTPAPSFLPPCGRGQRRAGASRSPGATCLCGRRCGGVGTDAGSPATGGVTASQGNCPPASDLSQPGGPTVRSAQTPPRGFQAPAGGRARCPGTSPLGGLACLKAHASRGWFVGRAGPAHPDAAGAAIPIGTGHDRAGDTGDARPASDQRFRAASLLTTANYPAGRGWRGFFGGQGDGSRARGV